MITPAPAPAHPVSPEGTDKARRVRPQIALALLSLAFASAQSLAQTAPPTEPPVEQPPVEQPPTEQPPNERPTVTPVDTPPANAARTAASVNTLNEGRTLNLRESPNLGRTPGSVGVLTEAGTGAAVGEGSRVLRVPGACTPKTNSLDCVAEASPSAQGANVSSRVRNSVIGEVGAGRGATEGGGNVKREGPCVPLPGQLSCQ